MSEPTPTAAETSQVELITQRYSDQIVGTLGCCDRVIITGTLTDVCHAGAVEGWLRRDHIRCFDLKFFAEPLRNQVRDHAILTPTAYPAKARTGIFRDMSNGTRNLPAGVANASVDFTGNPPNAAAVKS